MNIERLLTLADFLDAAPDDFDIRAWPTCAIGQAVTIPAFRAAGLRLVAGAPRFDGLDGMRAVAAFFEINENLADHLFLGSSYLTPDRPRPTRVEDLPYPRSAVTPAMVAQRIRALASERAH